MTDDRVLNLQGVHNFRDFGGYGVAGGGRLRRGVLWRSGQHFGATDGDLERIGALGLAVVFDLRSSRERTSHPCRRPQGFAAAVHLADDPDLQPAPHIAPTVGRTHIRRDPVSMAASLRETYGGIAFRPELMAMIRRSLTELAEAPGTVLINCMAGKDRTGIAVAALQLALGVHRDDVIADYLLTNTAGDSEARIAAGAETIRAVSGDIDMAVVRVLMGVEAEYLERAFTRMAERHGSIDGYLREALGADDSLRGRLRDALVEG